MLIKEEQSAVVISPHLDDGVFGCGDLMAYHPGSVVLTVFAGGPHRHSEIKKWDETAGFHSGDDIIQARRSEDKAALEILRAHPYWLDYWDSQYGRIISLKEIEEGIEQALLKLRPLSVFFPLGLYHSDHRLTSDACLELCRKYPFAWFFYEDAIYRRYPDHKPQLRLADIGAFVAPRHLKADGYMPTKLKRRAVDCYRSQNRAIIKTLGHACFEDIFAPESYWEVNTPNELSHQA